MNADPYLWWENAIKGTMGPLHEDEPVCGYFKMRDRRGLNKDLAPIKRPFVACAIWPTESGLKAEFAGTPTEVESIWPHCAKKPITFEEYRYWHDNNGQWPDQENAA